MKHPDIRISAGAYISAAAAILLLPWNWLLSWAVAVASHEFGHLLVLKCCRVSVYEIELGFLGAKITSGPLSAGQELLCAAAGPLCSFLLLLLIRTFPVAALIGLVQGGFNLIPVYPLDGGRMVRSVVRLHREKYG